MAPESKAYYNTGKSAIYGNDEGEVREYKGVLQNPKLIPYTGNLLNSMMHYRIEERSACNNYYGRFRKKLKSSLLASLRSSARSSLTTSVANLVFGICIPLNLFGLWAR